MQCWNVHLKKKTTKKKRVIVVYMQKNNLKKTTGLLHKNKGLSKKGQLKSIFFIPNYQQYKYETTKWTKKKMDNEKMRHK